MKKPELIDVISEISLTIHDTQESVLIRAAKISLRKMDEYYRESLPGEEELRKICKEHEGSDSDFTAEAIHARIKETVEE